MLFIVYIIYSHIKDKYYIGFSSNLAERIIIHNQKSKGFTGNVNDWKIVFTQEFETKTEALAREKQIKSWKSKEKITQLLDQ
jgi:putative endonuclease